MENKFVNKCIEIFKKIIIIIALPIIKMDNTIIQRALTRPSLKTQQQKSYIFYLLADKVMCSYNKTSLRVLCDRSTIER